MLIELIDVGFTYMPGTLLERVALKGVNLGIGEGELIGIIGPTGSGKSTLIQHLNGLLAPTEGRVLFNGKEVGNEIHPHLVRKEVGMVFQFPENQLFEETVSEDVSFGPKNLGLTEEEVLSRAEDALARVGLDFGTFAKRSPFSLSGGEKRLVAIAGALALKPRLLVLDEPTSGLDARGRARVMGCIKELNENGVTVVLIDHDMDEIAEYARRILVLSEGRIILDDRPSNVFAQPDLLRDIGIGIPKTTELLTKLRERGLDLPTNVVGLKGTVDAVLAAVKEGQCL